MSLSALTFAALLVGPAPIPFSHAPAADTLRPAPATWRIDAAHSDLTFRIRHMVSRVTGTFREWEGSITGDPADWSSGSVQVTIKTASIDTRHERRDNDLRSANFFDAANHPEITFRSSAVEVKGTAIRIAGNLTIRGTTKPVVLEGEYGGIQGSTRVGFQASTKLNRLDYGVSWNRAAEGGGVVLGDEVQIEINVEAVRQP